MTLIWINSRINVLSIISGLSYLSRPDLIIINFLDPFFRIILNNNFEFRRRINRIFLLIRNIFFILAIWFIFSILYFGFPFPVTAYSKLGVDIDRFEIILKGIRFFISFLISDLSAVAIILTGFILPLFIFFRTSDKLNHIYLLRVPFVILSNIFYTIYIGGDFFIGRFYYPLLISQMASI